MKLTDRITELSHLDRSLQAVQARVPMDLQIKGMHLYQRLKRRLTGRAAEPRFIEYPLPAADAVPIEALDPTSPFLYRQGLWQSYFKRLRDEAPVHWNGHTPFGGVWSITRYDDIMTVDRDHERFSAEPFIVMGEPPEGLDLAMFIAMDPPRHDRQRMAVQGVVSPRNLQEMESLIRSRTREVLDSLPLGTPFNWVERVSIELTARMLATLLDFPYEQRHRLVKWSDTAANLASATGGTVTADEAFSAMAEMAAAFTRLWHDKARRIAAGEPPGFDLISLLLTSPDTRDMIERPLEFLGNLALLIVGGNDTTRNSMSGGVYAHHLYPSEFAKLKANPELIPNMVAEIIRWQTPLAHMRRVATRDTRLGGQFIRRGDKLIMWYASGNRDERKFENADAFIIDRPNARQHMSFGFGVHRCMGNRLAELQLRILWEEILPRFDTIEVLEKPQIVQSNFVRGYSRLMVRLTPARRQTS
ncbi:Cytochrome P450 [Fontimonas thermophila]|uniref:Cytochrome P450 n=1 Tax=Fontimonas thermophila TaxID=1076937 RepID=A0A1I2JQK2_9GAMM|nr:cytochrome P450 [Fontimonas thermophila]SFF57072.1 Cytochrome P450 [Fontimonas thermophila]